MENSPAGRCWARPGTLTVQADATGTMGAEDALCVPRVRAGHRTLGVQEGARGEDAAPRLGSWGC